MAFLNPLRPTSNPTNNIGNLFPADFAGFGGFLESFLQPTGKFADSAGFDLYETETHVVIKVDAPGVDKKDVKVLVKGNRSIVISFTRRQPDRPTPETSPEKPGASSSSCAANCKDTECAELKECKKECPRDCRPRDCGPRDCQVKTEKALKYPKIYHSDASYGQFSCSISAPLTADLDHVSTTLENGVITIRTGKRNVNSAVEVPVD
jgi:HSP20 family molecular chaperone IbpA